MEEVLGIKDLYIEDVAGFEKNDINKKKKTLYSQYQFIDLQHFPFFVEHTRVELVTF